MVKRKTRNIITGHLGPEKTKRKCDICLKVKKGSWYRRALFSRPGEMIVCGDCASREAHREYIDMRKEIIKQRSEIADNNR